MDQVKKLGLDFGNVIKAKGQDKPVEGVLRVLPRLCQVFGPEIHIISKVDNDVQSGNVIRFVQQYLSEWVATCQFCYEREQKAGITKRLGITHMVDDRTEVLHYMEGIVPHRYAFNPTAGQIASFPPSKDVVIVTSWDELMAHLVPLTFDDLWDWIERAMQDDLVHKRRGFTMNTVTPEMQICRMTEELGEISKAHTRDGNDEEEVGDHLSVLFHYIQTKRLDKQAVLKQILLKLQRFLITQQEYADLKSTRD
jgi:NTP pyrophosphatase (non-canonical NTP hydrolase)